MQQVEASFRNAEMAQAYLREWTISQISQRAQTSAQQRYNDATTTPISPAMRTIRLPLTNAFPQVCPKMCSFYVNFPVQILQKKNFSFHFDWGFPPSFNIPFIE